MLKWQIEKTDLSAKKDVGFAYLAEAPYGALFSHAALAKVLDEPIGSGRYRQLMVAVGARLERETNRTLQSVRGEGYRIALPREHLELAHERHLRSVRQKRRGVQILEATHMASLTSIEQARLDERLRIERQHLLMMRSIKTHVTQTHRAVEQFIDEKLEAALARIEALETTQGQRRKRAG